MSVVYPGGKAYKKQPIINASESTVVQNTWYNAIATALKGGYNIISITTNQTNDETDAKDMEIELIADGITYTGTVSNLNATGTYWLIIGTSDAVIGSTTQWNLGMRVGLRVHTITSLRYRTTSAPGTNQVIYCRVQIEKLESVVDL